MKKLNNSFPKTVIIIAGPTASGKTAAAIEVARYFKTQIISADSRQCYKELNIGVARPSEEQLKTIPHHFIASHSIHDNITAAFFEQYALEKCEVLFKDHDVIVMVGGTGLYIRAFCEGLDKIPEIDPMIRQRIIINYEEKGIGWLQSELNSKDVLFSDRGEMQNPRRMMRALEVVESTGHSILSFRNTTRPDRPFNIIRLGLAISKEQLHWNINTRVDQMLSAGLAAEVMHLIPYRHIQALQTVGYREMFQYLEGKISLEKTVEQIKINTRQYAKRQLTWFRKDAGFTWVDATQLISPAFLSTHLWHDDHKL